MNTWLERTQLLLGDEKLQRLASAHVLVVGLGGVGGYAAELIARAGVGELTIVDCDTVSPTNLNRQLLALRSTISQPKTEVMERRLLDINPDIRLHTINDFLKDDKIIDLMKQPFTVILDCIDTLSPKTFLLYYALQNRQTVVSCMGSGGKTDPTKIEIADISKSYNCRLAFYIRKHLHRLGIRKGITVVFSPELVDKSAVTTDITEQNKASNVGTISYMPAAFGCFCASAVIDKIIDPQSPATSC